MRKALTGLILVLWPAAQALAGPPSVSLLQPISFDSPFPDGCGTGIEASHGGEVEPSVAVNPADPRNIVAAWQQDRYLDGGARSTLVGVSKDGGATWTTVLVPGISRCTGGLFPRATDPWVSIGPDGTAYLSSLSYDKDRLDAVNTVVVSFSTDGGSTWSVPSVVAADAGLTFFNDKESVTADPYASGTAYVVWRKAGAPVSEAYLSRTLDGGLSWSLSLPLPLAGSTQGHEIIVLSDRALLDVFVSGGREVRALRSEDKGLTWSLPSVKIGDIPGNEVVDPDTGTPLRTAPRLVSADAGPGRTAYVAWQHNAGGANRVVVARSADGGLTWTQSFIDRSSQVFVPSVAVDAAGTVGVTFYDFASDGSGDTALSTDFWFSHSHDAALSWTTARVAGPFDMRTAPRSLGRGRFIGDYQGLAALPDGAFAAAFAQAGPGTVGASDIFFARLGA